MVLSLFFLEPNSRLFHFQYPRPESARVPLFLASADGAFLFQSYYYVVATKSTPKVEKRTARRRQKQQPER